MVGNDIVDIVEAENTSNWERPRFLEKLFTSSERDYIYDAANPFLMVWHLWSMKESAYKLYTQLHPDRFYNPKKIECNIEALSYTVRYKNFHCYVHSNITSHYIMSEARLENKPMTSKCIKLIGQDYKIKSKTIKESLLTEVSRQGNFLKSGLKILKSDFGIPKVHYNSNPLNLSISLSHHGKYGAYAISRLE